MGQVIPDEPTEISLSRRGNVVFFRHFIVLLYLSDVTNDNYTHSKLQNSCEKSIETKSQTDKIMYRHGKYEA